MVKIFISYSRVDIDIVENRIYPLLARKYQHENVWYDDQIHGGDDWWQTILDSIAYADIFVYVLSNESVTSEYCQAEFHEAQRLQKFIVTVQVRDRTKLDGALSAIQYINMTPKVDQADALARLYTAIDRQDAKQIRRRKPLTNIVTEQPGSIADIESVSEDEVDTPTLQAIVIPKQRDPEQSGMLKAAGLSVLVIAALVVIIFAGWQLFGNLPGEGAETSETTEVVQQVTNTPTESLSDDDARSTGAAQAYATLTALAPTDTPTITPTPSNTPISSSDIQQTAQAEIFATETANAGTQAVIAQETQNAVLTEQFIAGATATYILQLSLTPPATDTPVPPTPTSTPDVLQLAQDGVSSNEQWEQIAGEDGYIREFDGVEMVLVPAGCFLMGNDSEAVNGDAVGGAQCFNEPFWIDRYEVTQADFDRLGGEQAVSPEFEGTNHPVENIIWTEARDFCRLRGGNLPTEAEWEYVARGPDNLYFPWGNQWFARNAVWDSSETANVGSIPTGASWVGAMDMIGNVWEWTNSSWRDYPFDPQSVQLTGAFSVDRVARGGSWIIFNDYFLRSSSRISFNPDDANNGIGFRCVRSYE